ncbi:MAG TPA: hypothetical protein VM684_06780 [Gaiellales bacterium]|nr:hypothetical protein [Gaiellales bacterium]
MTRLTRTTLAAGAAVLATAGVLATTGSAQSTGGTTLHLLSKSQKSVGFFPKHRPRPGDRFGFGDKVSGDDTGVDRGICTLVGRNQTVCTVQIQLSKGTLSAQGVLPQRSHNTPVAITGGTGAYDGARGTALVTDTSSSTSTVDVTLLP